MATFEPQEELQDQWQDALLAARLMAVDPHGLGVVVRARAGPVRASWLRYLSAILPENVTLRTMPHSITDDRLLGGIDLVQTLRSGRPVVARGFLSDADGHVVVLSMAERLSLDVASRLSSALDFGHVRLERDGLSDSLLARFGLVALDEGEDDASQEGTPPTLLDRLALHLDLDSFDIHTARLPLDIDALAVSQGQLLDVKTSSHTIETLCTIAWQLGIFSLRAPQLALRAAKAHAALSKRVEVLPEDLHIAVRLVLAPRATKLPQPLDEEDVNEERNALAPQTDEQPVQENNRTHETRAGALDESVLEAIKVSLPPKLLAQLALKGRMMRRNGEMGRHGATCSASQRGRPLASRRGDLRAGARLDVIGTLRAAAPWQKLRCSVREKRGISFAGRLEVRPNDFQIARFKERAETATIFAVDASGSTALSRLGEAKGAVELLLAESYARRDRVALVSFRNDAAQLLLAPTRSLVRAKRALMAMPGGGGTPLASGLEAAFHLTQDSERRGRTPTLVLLTDGSANITLDGTRGRRAAFGDALNVAKRLRTTIGKSLVVDISKRPNSRARELASAMDGHYIALPRADAHSLSNAVRAVQ